MTPKQLWQHIQSLPADTPRHLALSKDLGEGAGFGRAWYQNQKEHWQGWLGEYDGPGAYDRKEWASRDAKFIWNHIQCAPMLYWLAEALGLPDTDLDRAYQDIIAAPKRNAAQCAALRRVFPWATIEEALLKRPNGIAAKVKAARQSWRWATG
jgi:hypothetical protein